MNIAVAGRRQHAVSRRIPAQCSVRRVRRTLSLVSSAAARCSLDMAKKVLLALVAVAAGVGIWLSCKCCHPPKPPHLDSNEWWGPTELKEKSDNSIKPFKITFSDEMIKDLKDRLKNSRSPPPPLERVGFSYGFNSEALRSWVQYWAEKYPFKQREAALNKVPHFKTNIQGLDIHFIRIKPEVKPGVKVLPLLLLHGWPGSVREFYEAIPLLTKQAAGYDFAFEVIVPSLPGYGFSDAAVRPGLGAAQVAVIMRNLMHRLGHKQFYVQGGDWGSIIGSTMSVLYPDDVLGFHTNMAMVQNNCATLRTVIGAFIPSLIVEPHLADRMYPMSATIAFALEEFGYMHLQATKPDTVGAALTDSPAGLLAYILEKFAVWTLREGKNRPDGLLGERFKRDQLIDNLMLYWVPNSITTSMRLYAESMSNKQRALDLDKIPSVVPTWAMQAKHELFYQPPNILRLKYVNLLNTTVLDEGGHFIAFELPQIFVDDVFKAVKAFREFKKDAKTEL